jgi:hypothetical protein
VIDAICPKGKDGERHCKFKAKLLDDPMGEPRNESIPFIWKAIDMTDSTKT